MPANYQAVHFGPAAQVFEPSDIYLGQVAGSLELPHAGTTTVLGHAHGDFSDEALDAALNATMDSGIRTFFASAIHDLSFVNGYSIEDQEPKYSRLSTQAIGQVDNSPQLLDRYGVLNTSIPAVLSHASFISAVDMQLLRETKQYISTTPESEFHYSLLHAHERHTQDQTSPGVDRHFTFSCNMVGQAHLWLQTLRADSFNSTLEDDLKIPYTNPMSVGQAFLLIRRNGALALRRPDLGIIAEGAKADLVVFDGSSPNLLGWDDPFIAVTLHSNVVDISDVFVNGKFVKRDGKLTYSGYAAVRQDFLRSARKIQSPWEEMEFVSQRTNPLEFGITPYSQPRQHYVQAGPGTGY
ncbi:hypothetical protein A1O7_04233 [Cladophialophora yegresii CBS 114405]|uniref:Uncharacterized protein n=1 Tax=Cladophialophora yegresii CBS 114405 TaxID=1182544 RepID=W9VWM4_9EURO|nr:uncharacterized protein A1O7_04233 [Cladophialophora yegresii CBS 114405]EXJ60083.1 hypothetical protein A1O7_04233 [Cladophialophora yegresii CBS 114405]